MTPVVVLAMTLLAQVGTAGLVEQVEPVGPAEPAALPVVAMETAGATETAQAMETAWPMHTITSGPRGADGVHLADANLDGRMDVTSAWEQAGLVTVSLQPPDPRDSWPTVPVAQRFHGVEDAIFADIDGDGALDVVSACECRRIAVHFAPADPAELLDPAAWHTVVLEDSLARHRWIKVDVADVDGDGRLDIIGGGKADVATVGWFQAPEQPRDGSAWSYTVMSPVGWTMSLIAGDRDADGDVDVVLSDRIPIRHPDGTITYHLRGSRWLENLDSGTSWANHRIGFSMGEHKFLHIVDFDGDGADDVLDGASGPTYNQTFLRRNLGQWGPWEQTSIPQPGGVGHYQDVKAGDLDQDGDLDLAFSYSHADGELSGVAWLAAENGGWTRGEISGPAGTKYDNLELIDLDADGDLDVVTSEQVEQLGVIWYENPGAR